ncbi:hypothetical protein WJX77_003550 [Trebouxia sp. C0004]
MQRGSRRQKPSMASDRPGAALSAVFIVPLCPGLAAAARPLEEQQQQHVAPAGLNLTALVVLIEHFVFAYGYNCAVLMLSSASSTTILPNNTSSNASPPRPPVNSSAGESHPSPAPPTSPAQTNHACSAGRRLSQVFSEACGNAPGGTVSIKTSGTLIGRTSSSNETLPNAASSITILPPPHPPTNTTAKVGFTTPGLSPSPFTSYSSTTSCRLALGAEAYITQGLPLSLTCLE